MPELSPGTDCHGGFFDIVTDCTDGTGGELLQRIAVLVHLNGRRRDGCVGSCFILFHYYTPLAYTHT